jgi:penicillin-binding protein 1C
MQILYPQDNARLWVPRDFGGMLQKVTLRVAHRESGRKIFWYLDNTYLGSTVNRHEKAVDLIPVGRGWHILEVVDEVGYRDRKRFYVDMRE